MANTHTRLIAGVFVMAGVAIAAGACSRGGPLMVGPYPIKDPATGLWLDTQPTLTLRPNGSVCELTGKDTEVEVAKGRKVTWTVRNFCPTDQVLTVGNFRVAATSTATDCSASTENIAWPFHGNDENKREAKPKGMTSGSDPEEDKITLTDAKNASTGVLVYHFDVCLGSTGATKKVDPRLVIDP